ncbi:MAG: hypothetical protein RQ824_07040 [bacterium]|nr:hypothetical protein [bacterium]
MLNEGSKITISSLIIRFASYSAPFFIFSLILSRLSSPLAGVAGKLQLDKLFSTGVSLNLLYIALLYVVISTGLITLIMGRTSLPVPTFRLWLIYYPARAVFDLSSMLTGTMIGTAAAGIRGLSSLDRLADPATIALYTVLPAGFFLCTSINGSPLEERLYKIIALIATVAAAFLFYQKFIA